MTRLYLHQTTDATSGLPTSEQSSLTSNKDAEAQNINRTMNITIGTGQVNLTLLTNPVSTAQNYYFTRFVSPELNMSSISSNTWTYNFAATQNNTAANFPVDGTNGPVRVNVYVWRPSTSTKIGTVLDGNTASTVDEPQNTNEVSHHVTFSGSAVSGISAGDRLVFEVWFVVDTFGSTQRNCTFHYDGTTVNTTDNSNVSNHASFIETPQTLTFQAGTTPVSQTSIHKYDISPPVSTTSVGQSSVHKYHLLSDEAQSDGFSMFMRLSIPFINNEFLYQKRGVLFSKIDDEQVTHGYIAQLSDNGDIYFIVRDDSREYVLSVPQALDLTLFGFPDFEAEDFNSEDYFTQLAISGGIPDPLVFDDLAFTYSIEDHNMQLFQNGNLVASTANNPEGNGLVGWWRLVEGGDIGDDPDDPQSFSRIAYNSYEAGNNGTITNAVWINDIVPHETYLYFSGPGNADWLDVANYTDIQNYSTNGLTVSLWFRPKFAPTTGTLIQKNEGNNGSFIISQEGGSNQRISVSVRNDSGTTRTVTTATNSTQAIDTWYHVVLRWKPGENVKVNLDDVKSESGSTLTGTVSTSTAVLRMGSNSLSTVPYAYIHDVKIWNRQLSDSEVTTLYEQGHPHAGFPKWEANPPPPPEIPEPITNPFEEVYHLAKPASNFTWQKLHALVASGFTQVYQNQDGVTIPPVNIPFSTVYDFQASGGGGGGETTIYDVSQDSSSHIELNASESIRAGQQFNSGHSAIGKVVTKVTPRGRKFGSPSGTVYCRIWSSSGSLITTLDSYSVSNWTSSDTSQPQFVNTSNSYALQAGDVVGIEYSGGSTSNGIELQQNDQNPVSNSNAKNDNSGSGSWGDDDVSSSTDAGMLIIAGTAGSAGQVDFKGDDSNLGHGIYVSTSGSSLVGKVITRATFRLKKTGTISGTVTCRIYKSGTDVTMGTVNMSSITGTEADFTFTNLNNTYALVSGDWVGIEVSSSGNVSYISSFAGAGVTNGATEIRLKDTFLQPFIGTSYSWQQESNTDAVGKLEVGGVTAPEKLHYYALDGGAVRAVGERLINSSSVLNGKLVTRVKPKLQAVGNPTGTIRAVIRNSSGTEVGNLGTIEADSVSPTGFAEYEFTNILQSRTLTSGDRIMIEYTGSSINHIRVMIEWDESHGGQLGNEQATTFNGSSYTNITADLCGTVFVGGTSTDPDARERVGEKAETTNSILKLTKPSKALVWLRKVGSPPNNVFMRIRRQSDDTTRAVIGQIATSAITGEAQYEFTNSPVSVYAMQENDYILVEYPGGDDNNYVEVAVTTTDQIDSTDSILIAYDSLFTDYDLLPSQDLIATIYEGGDTFTPTGDEIPPPPPPKYTHDLHIYAGGYPYTYYEDADDSPIENWISSISPDIRFYRKILTLTELINIFTNRRDRANIPFGQVGVVGFFSLPPFS